MLDKMLKAAGDRHKAIAHQLICASEVTALIYTKNQTATTTAGSPLFSDVTVQETYVENGPYNCIWLDADAARATENNRDAELVARYPGVDVVAKFYLEDILVTAGDPYGATLLDRSSHLVVAGKRYEMYGYDRYGLGTKYPYMISVALKGAYTST